MKKIITGLIVASALFAQEAAKKVNYEESWLDTLSLEAYKTTYFIPASYYAKRPKSWVSTTTFKHVEMEVQFSLKYQFTQDLMGLDERYYVAYTHHSFWQIYAYSKPFRENIYNPEFFVRFPIRGAGHLTMIQAGYEHKSNGQYDTENVRLNNQLIGNLSKSIDVWYTMFRYSNENLRADLKLWYPMKNTLDDNPDMMDYYGYSSLQVRYKFSDNQVLSAMVRGNFATQKGTFEASYAYPLGKSINLYIKGFSGYVDTLVDYNQYVNKVGIGLSFSN